MPPGAHHGRLVSLRTHAEQEEFRRVVAAFADDVVAPAAADFNAEGRFPIEIIEQMGRWGCSASRSVRSSAGWTATTSPLCLAIEELGRVDQSVGITLEAGVGLGAAPLDEFGTDAQKQRWLPELCRGEKLGAFGLTEAGGGSDVFGTAAPARCRTATTGSSTGPSSSSPTPART
jgi:short-chain 2-methylacyl-CoA dehydrogenase